VSGGPIPLTQVVLAPTAVVVLAQRRGAFDGLGLQVRTVPARAADEQLQGLVDGRWDLAVTAVDDVLGWRVERGADLVILAQLETAPMQELYAPGLGTGLPGVVLVATQNWLVAHRGHAIRYLRALVNAAVWGSAPEHRVEARELIEQAGLPTHAAEHALDILSADLEPSLAAIQTVIQLHTEIGLLQPPFPEAAHLVDPSYLAAALQGG
jgi:ABC-type nitrate/sulfonate/bicarbonate transport system substrate-binding protein